MNQGLLGLKLQGLEAKKQEMRLPIECFHWVFLGSENHGQ